MNKMRIGFFGRRNVGKSSLINAIAGQNVAIVSNVAGTTTDPVAKSMELPQIGPCVLIDTAGIDDSGTLGALRVEKTHDQLAKADIAVFVTDSLQPLTDAEANLLDSLKTKHVPTLFVLNKCDVLDDEKNSLEGLVADLVVQKVSTKTGYGIASLINAMSRAIKTEATPNLVDDIVKQGDVVLLVTPIDSAAPKDRLILPQQQTIRAILDKQASTVVVRETQIKDALEKFMAPPSLVITDSQVFGEVSKIIPSDVSLTSFSILFARLKGDLATLIEGANAVKNLADGNKILISEGCTHHPTCDDIGRVKIPNWLLKHTGKQLVFEHSSGVSFPKSLTGYSLVVHCGACMLTRREMHHRMENATDAGVPIVNYGVLIALFNGILERAVAPFK